MPLFKEIINTIKKYRKDKKEAKARRALQIDYDSLRHLVQEEITKAFEERNILVSPKKDAFPTFRERFMAKQRGELDRVELH